MTSAWAVHWTPLGVYTQTYDPIGLDILNSTLLQKCLGGLTRVYPNPVICLTFPSERAIKQATPSVRFARNTIPELAFWAEEIHNIVEKLGLGPWVNGHS